MLYFDHSATTPVHQHVLNLMGEIESKHYGNPSSIHLWGRKTRSLIENARVQVAESIGAKPSEIIFTGGGSEANNQILWNLIHLTKKHVVTSNIEHPSILQALKYLKIFGITYTAVDVDSYGRINVQNVLDSIKENTGLVTIMLANNEVGTIQPISELASLITDRGIPFHSDAVQALGKTPISVQDLPVNMLSFSAHKFYGPKGIGFLYLRKEQKLKPLIIGGGQEHGFRAGTENVPGIVGMGLAAELATKSMIKNIPHLKTLEKLFRSSIINIFPNVILNGDPDHHLPGLISISFPGQRNDILTAELDRRNMAVSSGSACSIGSVKPSPILKAMGISDKHNVSTLRISFGKDNKEKDVHALVDALKDILDTKNNL